MSGWLFASDHYITALVATKTQLCSTTAEKVPVYGWEKPQDLQSLSSCSKVVVWWTYYAANTKHQGTDVTLTFHDLDLKVKGESPEKYFDNPTEGRLNITYYTSAVVTSIESLHMQYT